MIVCKNCGHQNEDNDTFCGSCGKFLEWTGERVAAAEPEPEPPPPAPSPEPEPVHHGFMDRVKQAVGIEETPPQPPQSVAPVAPPSTVASSQAPLGAAAASAAPAAAPAPVPYAPPPPMMRQVPVTSIPPGPPASQAPAFNPYEPRTAEGVAERQPVLAGVGAPILSPAPTGQEPVSQKPTSVAPPRTSRPAKTMAPPTRKAGPDDVYCGHCGEVNDRSRHFCRRCGSTLAEAIAVHVPWYRRFWNRLIHGRSYAAGERQRRIGPPHVMGAVWRIVRLALAALIVIAILAFALIPSFRTAVITRVTNTLAPLRVQFLPHYDAVYATGATASSSTVGHLPTLAVDHYVNTYWAALNNDSKPFLKILFTNPVDLAKIGFDSGASDNYAAQPRPEAVHIVCSDGTVVDLTLKDQDPSVAKNAQFYTLEAKHVTFVEIFINSTYPPAGASPSSVAISEVEFKTKD